MVRPIPEHPGRLSAFSLYRFQCASDSVAFALRQGDDRRFGRQSELGQARVNRIGHDTRQLVQITGGAVMQQRRGKIGHLHRAFGLHRAHPIDTVFQLAHISRPIVGLKGIEQLVRRLIQGRPDALPSSMKWVTSIGISSLR